MISKELSRKIQDAFPKMYINASLEAIIYKPQNSYFCLENCNTEEDVQAKILEWLSRDAHKETSRQCQVYLMSGINKFLGTHFSKEDMCRIYIQLGNCVNHDLTLSFIRSGFDMSLLKPLPEFMKGAFK